MPVNVARKVFSSVTPLRVGYCVGLAGILLAVCCTSLQNATAEGDTRTITLHHVHTEEDLTITYKVNGVYDEEALKKIDHELRDWRRDEAIHMDPRLIDLVWEVRRDVGSTEPIYIVCGYRSPQTNSMLRARSSGVAKFSQHVLGKAMDFYIPGVPLEQIRAVGLYLQRGGVGFYPTSGSPFVHLDTGNVRHWPSIATGDMPRLMSEGHSLHNAAEAAQLAANHRQPAVMAKLGGRAAPDQAPATAARPTPVINLAAQISKPAPPPKARTLPAPATFEMASAESHPVELRPAQQASLVIRSTASANDVINQRDYWHSLQDTGAAPPAPQTDAAPRPPAPIPNATVVASADPQVTASISPNLAPWPLPERGELRGGALAYADPTAPVTAREPRAAPMGTTMGHPTAPPPDTTVALKRVGDRPSVISSSPAAPPPPAALAKAGDQFNEPWLRALIVSPSAQDFMTASSFGATDFRGLAPYLRKPPAAVVMTFTNDPQLGMTARKFSGTAIVFVSTVTFGMRTASLR